MSIINMFHLVSLPRAIYLVFDEATQFCVLNNVLRLIVTVDCPSIVDLVTVCHCYDPLLSLPHTLMLFGVLHRSAE